MTRSPVQRGVSALSLVLAALATSPVAAQEATLPSLPPGEASTVPTSPPAPAPAPSPAPAPAPSPPEAAPVAAGAPSEPPAAEPPAEGAREAPAPHRGFQVAVRGGLAVPFGSAARNAALPDRLGSQFAAIIDVGIKVIPELFLGAYLGANVGGVGGQTSQTCSRASATCLGATYRIGVQLHYHFLPAGKVDPWVGYGVGYEVSRVTGSGAGQTFTQTLSGPEYGHFLAGVDFRLTKVFGIGPFVDLALAQYANQSAEVGLVSTEGEIADKALHQWLTVGAKFLFFP